MIRSGRQSAFTLIELLVAMSILALLASVILTATSLARTRAYDGKYTAEIRQFRTALEQYKLQYNEYPTIGNAVTLGWDTGVNDKGGNSIIDTTFSPLVPTYIVKIPHYNKFVLGSEGTSPLTWMTYFKNAPTYRSDQGYYSCAANTNANNVLGKSILLISYAGIGRAFTGPYNSFTVCTSPATNCQAYSMDNTVTQPPGGTSLICIPLD